MMRSAGAVMDSHLQVKKHLEADVRYLHKVRGSGAYSLTELADKLLPEVPVSAQNISVPSVCIVICSNSSCIALHAGPCRHPSDAALSHETD